VFHSKAVGEPPLLLAFSVLLAIRDAIAAALPDVHGAPPLRAPATPEAILDALEAFAASQQAVQQAAPQTTQQPNQTNPAAASPSAEATATHT
jgi:xanthine dehydrogenase large subunit